MSIKPANRGSVYSVHNKRPPTSTLSVNKYAPTLAKCISRKARPAAPKYPPGPITGPGDQESDNDANVLTLGAGLIGPNLARQIVQTWLTTDYAGGRHQRRIDKITEIEKRFLKNGA